MLSKCANPECNATFLYFHRGKLFRLETESGQDRRRTMGSAALKPLRRVEFFWLCQECAGNMTLAYDKGTGVSVRTKLDEEAAAAASAA